MADEIDRPGVLGQVRNPLIFFALALLIIEGIIGLVVAKSQMSGEYQFYSVCLMSFLFLVVVITVAVITVKWPRHLYEEVVQELQMTRALTEILGSPGLRDTIEDVLANRIKPECFVERQGQQEG